MIAPLELIEGRHAVLEEFWRIRLPDGCPLSVSMWKMMLFFVTGKAIFQYVYFDFFQLVDADYSGRSD